MKKFFAVLFMLVIAGCDSPKESVDACVSDFLDRHPCKNDMVKLIAAADQTNNKLTVEEWRRIHDLTCSLDNAKTIEAISDKALHGTKEERRAVALSLGEAATGIGKVLVNTVEKDGNKQVLDNVLGLKMTAVAVRIMVKELSETAEGDDKKAAEENIKTIDELLVKFDKLANKPKE